MRHVRMLGTGLVVAFSVCAMAAVPALAAKTAFSVKTWTQFKNCPYEDPEVENCYLGQTSGGKNGGFFELGNVRVPLSKPISLQGGFRGVGSEIILVPAAHGGETLESPELKVPGGLGVITKKIEQEAEWPQALQESFNEARKNKESGLDVKIELAGGNLLYETVGALDTERIIGEQGPGFTLPLKVKVTGPFLEKLGGGPCLIGNDASPIWQFLTTEGAGAHGQFEEGFGFENLELSNDRLVDLGWTVEAGSRASGCGGSDEQYVDAALNDALELNNTREGIPIRTGITVLQGNVYTGLSAKVKEEAEAGNV